MKTKKYFLILLSIIISTLVISSCTSTGAASSWPGFSVDGSKGYVSFANQTYAIDLKNGSLIWKYPAEADRTRQAYSAPQSADGIVFFGDYNGLFIAVNAENGTKKWEFSGADDRYIAGAEISNGMVYIPNTDKYIYALDTEGNLGWKFLAAGPNWTKPVSNDTHVFIASMDHNVYAFTHSFNAASLELAKDGSKTLRNDFDWIADLGMAIVADPVLEDDVIYAATIEGKLFAIDVNSGKIIWSFDDNGNLGSVWGSPVIDGSTIFVADMNGNVYTVDKSTGKQVWPSPFSAGGKIVGGGVLTPDGVVFATGGGKLFLINQEKEPKTMASYEKAIYSPVQLSGENLIIAPASEAGLLAAIGVEGFEVWSFIPSDN